MEKRDFLLREIEKLAQLIRRLLGIVEDITFENFDIEFGKVDDELADFFGFNIEELTQMENSELINQLKGIDEINIEFLTLLISKTINKLQSISNNSSIDSKELAKKGIVLIDFIDDKSKTFSINRMNLKKELQEKT